MRIAADDGSPVEPGEVGEVLVQGPTVMPEYWRNPEATRETFHADGWLRTGDAGCFDDEGMLSIVDRIKEVIIVGSCNVYPADVESVLDDCPQIAEAAVVGRPDDELGEVPVAFVVLREPDAMSADDVKAPVRRPARRVQAPAGRGLHRRAAAQPDRQGAGGRAARAAVRDMKKALVLVALLVVLLAAGLVPADIVFENTKVKTHTFPGPIDEIVVRSDGGDVELVRARGRGRQVRETQHYLLKQPTLERDVEDGVLTLEARCEASFVTCFSDLRVSVPAGAMDHGRRRLGRRRRARDRRRRGAAGERLGRHAPRAARPPAARARARRTRATSTSRRATCAAIDAQTDSGDVVVTTRAARDVDGADGLRRRRRRGERAAAPDPRRHGLRRRAGRRAGGRVRASPPKTDSGDVEVDGISRNDRAARSIEARTDSGDVTLQRQMSRRGRCYPRRHRSTSFNPVP